MVCIFPLFHMGAWTISLQQWQARDLVAYVTKPDARCVGAIRQFGATGSMRCRSMAAQSSTRSMPSGVGGDGHLPQLRLADSGTSATPPALLDAIAEACPNAWIRIFYGSTEAGNVSSLTGPDVFRKPNSCGVPSQASEVRLDPDTGELCVRGPLLFDGYYGNPEATSRALQDGWYRTGDLAARRRTRATCASWDARTTSSAPAVNLSSRGGRGGARRLPGAAEVAVVGLPDDTGASWCGAVVVADGLGSPPTLEVARERCTRQARRPSTSARAAAHRTRLPRTPATRPASAPVLSSIERRPQSAGASHH